LRALDARVRSTIKQLEDFKPILSRLRPASTGYGTFFELGKVAGGLIAAARKVIEPFLTCILSDLKQVHPVAQSAVACIEVVYKVGPCSYFGNMMTD